jgi:hypothetical protein
MTHGSRSSYSQTTHPLPLPSYLKSLATHTAVLFPSMLGLYLFRIRFKKVNCLGTCHDAVAASLGGMYELCARLAPYNLLSDAGFSPGEGGLIRTTTSFLEDIEYEFNHQYSALRDRPCLVLPDNLICLAAYNRPPTQPFFHRFRHFFFSVR